jgi:hypothetical protein
LLVNSDGKATDASGNSLSAAKETQLSGAFGVNDTIQLDSGLWVQPLWPCARRKPLLATGPPVCYHWPVRRQRWRSPPRPP